MFKDFSGVIFSLSVLSSFLVLTTIARILVGRTKLLREQKTIEKGLKTLPASVRERAEKRLLEIRKKL